MQWSLSNSNKRLRSRYYIVEANKASRGLSATAELPVCWELAYVCICCRCVILAIGIYCGIMLWFLNSDVHCTTTDGTMKTTATTLCNDKCNDTCIYKAYTGTKYNWSQHRQERWQLQNQRRRNNNRNIKFNNTACNNCTTCVFGKFDGNKWDNTDCNDSLG